MPWIRTTGKYCRGLSIHDTVHQSTTTSVVNTYNNARVLLYVAHTAFKEESATWHMVMPHTKYRQCVHLDNCPIISYTVLRSVTGRSVTRDSNPNAISHCDYRRGCTQCEALQGEGRGNGYP